MPIETDESATEEKKRRTKKPAISLSNGYGPLTQQEKKHLLAFALANKYDLYTPQNNATLAACTGEYLDATLTAEDTMQEIAEEPEAEAFNNSNASTNETALEAPTTEE